MIGKFLAFPEQNLLSMQRSELHYS